MAESADCFGSVVGDHRAVPQAPIHAPSLYVDQLLTNRSQQVSKARASTGGACRCSMGTWLSVTPAGEPGLPAGVYLVT